MARLQEVEEAGLIDADEGEGFTCDSPLAAAQRQRRRTRAVLAAGTAAFAVCAAVAVFRGGARGGALGDVVSLAAEGSIGAFGQVLKPSVLKHLWHVERMLVDANLCPPATPEVDALQKQQWPRTDAPSIPRIDKIVYINVAWDKARKRYMDEQLQRLSFSAWESGQTRLKWQRFEAITDTALKHDPLFTAWRAKGFSKAASPNVTGDWKTAACAFSHYAAIRQVEQPTDGSLVIIAEDDVEFNPDFLRIWGEVWPYIPQDWDVLRVGWFSDHQNCSQVINAKVDRAGWQDPRNGECAYCGAQAYIVNPTRKERVLRRFERSRITHADELLGAPTPQLEDIKTVPPLQVYVIWPMLADIHTDAKGRVTFKSDRIEGRNAVSKSVI